ncbi:MAG: hypothetical protein AAF215_19820 [Cyanobacteria bacterium P01_A01_bin.123]
MNNQLRQELALLFEEAKPAESDLITSADLLKLTQEDLAEISGGQVAFNHNETIISKAKPAQTKSKEIVELSVEDLGEILGGVQGSYEAENGDGVSMNHNETLMSTPSKPASDQPKLVTLSAEDLTLICGGRGKEDDEPIGEG